MLLTMDVGNTNITAGIFVEKDLVELFRITTKLPRTSDEFGILIRDMIAAKGLDTKQISAAGDILKLPLVDHIIVGENTYFSFREHELLNGSKPDNAA